jgi:glycosyltransferase involved in cell wall biosynthesis
VVPRILLMVDSLDVGGAERHVIELAASLVQSDWSVTIACSIEGALAPLARRANVEVVPLLRGLAKRRVSPAYAWQLRRLLRRRRFDLIHAHMFASASAAALACSGTATPLVLTEHSEASWRRQPARWFGRSVYSRATHVIAVSDSIRRRLIHRDGVPAERVSTIPNAYPSLVDQAPVGMCSALRQLEAIDGPCVGVIARLQPEKGVQYLIEAAAQVHARVPQACFIVVGDGPLREPLARLADDLGIDQAVVFLGFRLDAAAVLSKLDVLVVPSLSEGTPLVVLEAMVAGVPVVASAVGGIPEQIRHGQDGWLVPAGDSGPLGAAIADLLENPARARQMGQVGRERAVTCFSPRVLLDRTAAVYRHALRAATSVAASDTLEIAAVARR